MLTTEGEIQVIHRDEVVHVEPIGPFALMVGRSPDNDLRLADSRVSSHHLVLRWAGESLLVQDLGSRNGTFLNEVPVSAPTRVSDSDVIRLGRSVRLRVRLRRVSAPVPAPRPRLLVIDLKTGLLYTIRSDRFRIGAREGADIRLPEGEGAEAVLSLHDNGEIWLGTDDEEHAVVVGEPFEIGGHRFLIRDDRALLMSTERELAVQRTRYPYRLRVSLTGQGGPEARIEDPRSGIRHVIRAENRVALLYLLAQHALRDMERQVPPADRGWTSDEDVMVGVWGRRHETLGPNNYQVLLCRLRKEITDAGLDAWFIEKRANNTRIVLDDIQVETG